MFEREPINKPAIAKEGEDVDMTDESEISLQEPVKIDDKNMARFEQHLIANFSKPINERKLIRKRVRTCSYSQVYQ